MTDNTHRDSGITTSSEVLAHYAETALMYEELRAAIDGGHESMTHADALAEISAMRAKAASTTDSYVQPVPEKCDRIVWRGNYYHLPPAAQAADSVLEDAERWRWLRENWFTMTSSYDQQRIRFKVGEPRWSDITETELDAAIDAARKQGGAA